MNELVLTLREQPPGRFDASPLAADRLAKLSAAAIERLPLRLEGGTTVPLAEVVSIAGRPSSTVRLVGDFSAADGIGANMTGGHLSIDGNAGRRVGMRMRAGSIELAGDAADDVGLEMEGGRIVVRGSVGKRTGSAGPGGKRGMAGGEIIVFGNAGEQTGACLRRGIIAIGGRVDADVLRAAIAGTVVAAGDVESPAGRWSKRASLVALGGVDVSPTYRYACTFRPSFLRVLLIHLRREYGFPVTDEQAAGSYRRYAGDFAESGRGEILHWTGE